MARDADNPYRQYGLQAPLGDRQVMDLDATVDDIYDWLKWAKRRIEDLEAQIGEGGGGSGAPHNLLSTEHPDTLPASVATGALITGKSGKWQRETAGAPGQILVVNPDGTLGWTTGTPGGGGATDLDYLGGYAPGTYNDGDIVIAEDGVAYVCTKDGVTTPPEPWPGGGGGGGGGGGTGDVVGPAGATADAIALYDGTTGKLIKDSGQTIALVITDAVAAAEAAILPVNLVTETTGTLPQARLPGNVAYEDDENVFTRVQRIYQNNAAIVWRDLVQVADDQTWTTQATHYFSIYATKMDGTPAGPTTLLLRRNGDAEVGNILTATGGLGATPLNASQLSSGSVPFARVPVSAASKILGRGAGGAGAMEEIALGTNLSMSGTTLNVAGGGTGNVVGPASATDGAVALYDGTTGKLIKNSTVLGSAIATKPVNLVTDVTGTLPIGNLPANVATKPVPAGDLPATIAYENEANVFTQNQRIEKATPALILYDSSQPAGLRYFRVSNAAQKLTMQGVDDDGSIVHGSATVDHFGVLTAAGLVTQNAKIEKPVPSLHLNDPSQPSGSRYWAITTLDNMYIQALDDAGTGGSNPLQITRAGDYIAGRDTHAGRDIYEKGRTVPLGHSIAVPYNAANFYIGGGSTFTVEAGDIVANSYSVVGKTLFWTFNVGPASIGGTPATTLIMVIPGGFVTAGGGAGICKSYDAGGPWFLHTIIWGTGVNYVQLVKLDFANWNLNTNSTYLQAATLIIPIL